MKYNCEIEAKDFKINGESVNKSITINSTGSGSGITSISAQGKQLNITRGTLTVDTLNGLTSSISELNQLKGVNYNIAEKFNSLGNAMSFLGVYENKASLLLANTAVNGSTAIVKQDETNSNKQMTYVYTSDSEEYDSSNWNEVAENNIELRNFNTNPIDLSNEVTGSLGASSVTGLSSVATSGSYNDLSNTPNSCIQSNDLSTITTDGSIVQYIGETTSDYTNGLFYKLNNDTWNNISVIDPVETVGQFGVSNGSEKFNDYESNTCTGTYSHAEGSNTKSEGNYSHAEGKYSTASGECSHAEGFDTVSSDDYSHVFGVGNTEETGYVEMVGNSKDFDAQGRVSTRSNARTLDWSGNEVLKGSCTATDFILSSGGSLNTCVSAPLTINATNTAGLFSSHIECLGKLRIGIFDITLKNDITGKTVVLATYDTKHNPPTYIADAKTTLLGVPYKIIIQNGDIKIYTSQTIKSTDAILAVVPWICAN